MCIAARITLFACFFSCARGDWWNTDSKKCATQIVDEFSCDSTYMQNETTTFTTHCDGKCFEHGICGESENWYSPKWTKKRSCESCECESSSITEAVMASQLVLLIGVTMSLISSGFLFVCISQVWFRAHFARLRCCLILSDRLWFICVMIVNATAMYCWTYLAVSTDYACCFKLESQDDPAFCIQEVFDGSMLSIDYSNNHCILPSTRPACTVSGACNLDQQEPRNLLLFAFFLPFVLYIFFFNFYNILLPITEIVFKILMCGNDSCCSRHPSVRPWAANTAYGPFRFVTTFYNNVLFSSAFWLITFIFFESTTISKGFLDVSFSAGQITPQDDSWYDNGWVLVFQSTRDEFNNLLDVFRFFVMLLLGLEVLLNITDSQRSGPKLSQALGEEFLRMTIMSIGLFFATDLFYRISSETPDIHRCISDKFDFFILVNLIMVLYVVFLGRWIFKNIFSSRNVLLVNSVVTFGCVVAVFICNLTMLNQLTGIFSGESKMHCQYIMYNIAYLWVIGFMLYSSGKVLCMYVNRLLFSFINRYFRQSMERWESIQLRKQYRADLIQFQMERWDFLRKRFRNNTTICNTIKAYMDDLEVTVPPLKDYLVVERIIESKEVLLFGEHSGDMVMYRTQSEDSIHHDIELQNIYGRDGEITHARFDSDLGGSFDSFTNILAEPAPGAAPYEPPSAPHESFDSNELGWQAPPRYQDVANANVLGSESWGLYNDQQLDQPPGYNEFIHGVSNLNQEEGKSDWNRF